MDNEIDEQLNAESAEAKITFKTVKVAQVDGQDVDWNTMARKVTSAQSDIQNQQQVLDKSRKDAQAIFDQDPTSVPQQIIDLLGLV